MSEIHCVSCFGARQFAGVDGLEHVARQHDKGGAAVVIFRGMGYCEEHWNLARGFPAGFPAQELPEDLLERVADRYEEAGALLETSEAEEAGRRREMRKARKKRA